MNINICKSVKISPIGTGTSFCSSSLDAMRVEVWAFRIKVLAGLPKIKFNIEQMRMACDAKNKPLAASILCWIPELVPLCCSVILSSVLLIVLLVVLVALRLSMYDFMSSSKLLSVATSAATMTKGRQIAWMMVRRLISIPFLGEDLKQARKIQPQDLFILLK